MCQGGVMDYKNLFKPIKIGKTYVKNRIALAPMNDLHQFYNPEEGTINRRWVDYFTERAKGGVGLIITGAFKVEDEITRFRQNDINIWALLKRKSIQNYSELNKYAHTYGAKVFIQLTAGPGRVMSGLSIDQGFEPISASATPAFFRPETICRPLEIREVDKLVDAFGKAAEIVRDAGFDGIEVHGHEGYLIDQFVTKIWNKRKDKYGGDLDGRLTFPKNILKAIRNAVGDELTVIYRYGGKHFLKDFNTGTLKVDEIEVGRDLEESIEIAKRLEAAGYDGLHIDCGCYESVYWAHPPTYMPEGVLLDYSSSIKKAVNIPVIGVGKLGNPAIAESALAENKIDMIALGRDLLSDPEWPNKVFLGKEKEIRRCIGCHECMYLAETGKYLTCAVNPFCGNENIVTFKEIDSPKNVAIIGGGVAGMESARILKIRGHNVQVFEKKDHLGGHLLPAARPEIKSDLRYLVDWYEHEMKKHKIDIHFNKNFTLDELDDEEFDVYIVATGSEAIELNVRGIDKSKVASSIEIINGEKKLTGRLAIIGGGVEGCETAISLASKGQEVIIIEKLKDVARGIHRANKAMILEMLKELSIPIYTSATAMEVNGDELKIYNQKSEVVTEKIDGIVVSIGMKPVNKLYYDLIERGKVAHLIGDGYKPGKIADAVWQATMLCTEL